MEHRTEKKIIVAVLISVFLVMLALTSLTPLLADDYSYSFSYADRSRRIDGLGMIAESMGAHRETMNGRVFSHGLAQLFLMLPKPVFNFFNALNATLLTALIYLYFRSGDARRDLLSLLCAVFSVWIFMPVFGQVFLWLDGSLNYSWTMSFTLAYAYPFFSMYMGRPVKGLTERGHFGAKLPYLLLAFVSGAYSESASFTMLLVCAAFLLLVFLRDRRLPPALTLSLSLAFAGFIYMMSASSELGGRTSDFSFVAIAHNIQRICQAPQESLQWLYCILAALFAMGLTAKIEKKYLIAAAVLTVGSFASIGVYVVAAYFPWRSLCATTFYLLLPCLILSGALIEKGFRFLLPVFSSVLFSIFIFSFVLGVGDIGNVFVQSLRRESLLKEAGSQNKSYAEIYQYDASTKYAAPYLLPDAYEDPGEWPNYDIAQYYGIGAVSALPPEA